MTYAEHYDRVAAYAFALGALLALEGFLIFGALKQWTRRKP
jgi:hypothetical protein